MSNKKPFFTEIFCKECEYPLENTYSSSEKKYVPAYCRACLPEWGEDFLIEQVKNE